METKYTFKDGTTIKCEYIDGIIRIDEDIAFRTVTNENGEKERVIAIDLNTGKTTNSHINENSNIKPSLAKINKLRKEEGLKPLTKKQFNANNGIKEQKTLTGKGFSQFYNDDWLRVGDKFTVKAEMTVITEKSSGIEGLKNVSDSYMGTPKGTIPVGTQIEYVGSSNNYGSYYNRVYFKIVGTDTKFYAIQGELRKGECDWKLSSEAFDRMIVYKSDAERVKVADQLVDEVLKEMNIKDLHLANYKQSKEFEKKLQNKLWQKRIDLSYRSARSTKYGVDVGGNRDGIAYSYANVLKKAWKPVKWTAKQIQNYLKKHPNVSVYQEDKYGSYDKVSKENLLKQTYGTKWQHMGIGSQSSTHEYTTTLTKDKEGNLCISTSHLVWD